MKRLSHIAAGAFFILFVFSAFSCRMLDVIGRDSIRAFGELLQSSAQLVSEDAFNGGWSFSAPDNSARFFWSRSFAESPAYDVMMEFDAAPFLNAGLDPSKLPDTVVFNGNTLIVGTKLGNENLIYKGEAAPLASYEHIVNLKRNAIGYHASADHYGVSLGNGNLFEWAKNLKTNDKDIVFVLEPDPFLNAGVDPNRIEGWLFARVLVEDRGRMVEVDKFLKPFDLL